MPATSPATSRLAAADGTPLLWCPPITHYDASGAIDHARTAAHLSHLARHVGGLLAAGSTGDGWTLDERRHRTVVQASIDAGRKHGLQILVGVLRKESAEVVDGIRAFSRSPAAGGGFATTERELAPLGIRGFTVCGPVGSGRAEAEVEAGLRGILELGVPVALYQLPQVTGYELSPALVQRLAAGFRNFRWFKDTSGADRVALAPGGLPGVFMVRGAEGDYARWMKSGGGPYDGFLLSTANAFAAELDSILRLALDGRRDEAARLSERLTAVVRDVFAAVQPLTESNAFANANKSVDHYMAHGARAATAEPPRFPSGRPMPADVLRTVGSILESHQYMPKTGYLAGA